MSVSLGLFFELSLEGLDFFLDLRSLLVVDLVNVRCACVNDLLVKDPGAVKTYNSLFKVLVGQVVFEKHLLDVILEALHFSVLAVNLCFHNVESLGQTLLSHPEIIDNEDKVLIDSVEVLLFSAHLVGLLIEFLNLDLFWTDVSFKLFDFVIENKLELF